MTAIYQKNLSKLAIAAPQLHALLSRLDDVPAVTLVAESYGVDLKLSQENGKAALYYGEALASATQKIQAQLKFVNPRVVVFVGLGLGHHVLEFVKNPPLANQLMVVVEPFAHVFRAALQTTDFAPLFDTGRVAFFVGSKPDELRRFFADLFLNRGGIIFANAIEYALLPQAGRLTPQFFELVPKIVAQSLGQVFNLVYSDAYDAVRGFENILLNLEKLKSMPSLTLAKNTLAGKPGLVIASGPSLKEVLPALKKLAGKVVMAACPSALPALMSEGIHPEIWLDIERNEADAEFFKSLNGKADHLFVASPLVKSGCFDNNGGHNVYFKPEAGTFGVPLPGEILEIGHSTAHAAFAILKNLGCTKIFLIGQDLCEVDGKTHADGVWQESANYVDNLDQGKQRKIEVLGNSGKPVHTNVLWNTYLRSLTDDLIPRFNGQVFHVISENAGVKIPGTTRVDPLALTDHVETSSGDVLSQLKNLLKTPASDDVSARSVAIKNYFASALTLLTRYQDEANALALKTKTVQFHDDFIAKKSEQCLSRYKELLSEIDKFMLGKTGVLGEPKAKTVFDTLFWPMIQGLTIKNRIEFYTGADDITGNVSAMSKKLEILFHLFKDQAFWAGRVAHLISHNSQM